MISVIFLIMAAALSGCAGGPGATTSSPPRPTPARTAVQPTTLAEAAPPGCVDAELPALVLVPPPGRDADPRRFILAGLEGEEHCSLEAPYIPWASTECQVVGKRLMCWDETRNALQLLDVRSGKLAYVDPELEDEEARLDFLVSPDGTRIVWSTTVDAHQADVQEGTSRCRVTITHADGSEAEIVLEEQYDKLYHLVPAVWMPWGKAIYFARMRVGIQDGGAFIPTFSGRHSELYRLHVASGEFQKVFPSYDVPVCNRCISDVSSDGHWLAYHGEDGSVVVSATVVVTLTTSAAALPDVTPPPRGWIAFKTPEEQLALITPDGSRGVTVTEQAEVGSFAWSPDGRSFAFVRDGQLMLLSIEDNRVVSLTGPGTTRSPELAWSRDSRHLAYLHSLEKGSRSVAPDALRVLDVAAREAVTVSTYSNTRPEEKAVICPQPFTYPLLPVTSPWSKTVQIWNCRDAEVVGELHTASNYCDYLWFPDTEAIVLAEEETDKAGIEWTCLQDTQVCMKGETKVTHPTSVAVWRMGEDAAGDGALTVVLEGTQTRHYHPTRWLPDGRLEVQVKAFEETSFDGPAQPARVTYTYLTVTEDGRLQEAESIDVPWWAAGGFRERFEATDLYREQDRERPVTPGWEVSPNGETVAFGWSRQIDAEEWERVIYMWQGEEEPRRLTAGSYPQWQPEVGTPSEQIRRVWSPDGQWTAIVDEAAGSLALEGPDGDTSVVLPEGSTVGAVAWAPDGKLLLVERTNWLPPEGDQPQSSGPPEIWAVRLTDGTAGPAALLFRSDAEEVEEQALGGLAEVVFGRWAPDGRHVFLWVGASGSIRADGNAPWVLDRTTGDAVRPADWALVNPRYYSWAPDSSALAITAGGGRSAQVNKWLNIVDVDSGELTTVISDSEQVPGIVAWSPAENSATGDRIAYAAVPAEETGKQYSSLMTFENPAIAARRIYLLDPSTGETRRLNDAEGYQDAPVWSRDGERLYYVQQDREADTLVLMVADPETGEAQPIEASRRPAPPDTRVGYYGQAAWNDVLGYLPDDATWEPDGEARDVDT